MKVIICHPGTQYSHYLAIELYQHGYLSKFYTGIAFGNDHIVSKLNRFLPKKISRQLKTRIIENLPDKFIKRNIANELRAIYKIKKGLNQEQVFFKRNKSFQENISDKALKSANIVVGYDTSSWIIAKRCKNFGINFILDVSIGHPTSKNEIFKMLSEKYPDWSSQIQIKNQQLIDYERLENELATLIATPSSFVKTTYIQNGIDKAKIHVNPFGTDTSYFKFHQKNPIEKIKFLFFGSLTARKGLPLLLAVWEESKFDNAELTIAGFGELPDNYILPKNVIKRGKIAKEDRGKLFEEHHIFVFPSNFEGFAQVQIEAAVCGLPIISTNNAGGSEIVEDGYNGFLINPEQEIELKNVINFFINNKEQIAIMSENQKNIISNFTWTAYGKRWIDLLNKANS